MSAYVRIPEATREAVLNAWATGQTGPTIEAILGVSENSIRNAVQSGRYHDDPRAIPHPSGSCPKWTDDLTARLRMLWATDASCRVIAAKLGNGFTKNSIIGKAHRLKLANRKGLARGPMNPARVWRAQERRAARRGGVSPSFTVSPVTRPPAPKPLATQAPSLVPDRVLPFAPIDSNPVSILARTERQCSHIAGEARGPETIMCGAPVVRHSLCAGHLALCWLPGSKKATNPNGTSRRSTLIPFVGEVPFS